VASEEQEEVTVQFSSNMHKAAAFCRRFFTPTFIFFSRLHLIGLQLNIAVKCISH
jgi:hypothetical protein